MSVPLRKLVCDACGEREVMGWSMGSTSIARLGVS